MKEVASNEPTSKSGKSRHDGITGEQVKRKSDKTIVFEYIIKRLRIVFESL